MWPSGSTVIPLGARAGRSSVTSVSRHRVVPQIEHDSRPQGRGGIELGLITARRQHICSSEPHILLSLVNWCRACQDTIRKVEKHRVRGGRGEHPVEKFTQAVWVGVWKVAKEFKRRVAAKRLKCVLDHQFSEAVDHLIAVRQLCPRNRHIGLARQFRSILHHRRFPARHDNARATIDLLEHWVGEVEC
jgi:hypothetical protein